MSLSADFYRPNEIEDDVFTCAICDITLLCL